MLEPRSVPPLDFVKIEALRTHMLLTTEQMAKLLSVSRITYYGWKGGKPVRKVNAERVRHVLRKMLRVLTRDEWPSLAVIAMTSEQRFAKLVEAMEQAN
ncbi:MAG: hypothetical protein JW395_0564 [Nitrospira sp.]|nr:hypothetical protein [Nitrospira sp.]